RHTRRLPEEPDGTIRYTMKRRFSDGRQEVRCAPRELLFRLTALIPSPRSHTVRYAGVFAAHARGRYALTGRGMHDQPTTLAAPRPPAPSSVSPTEVATVQGPDAPDRMPRGGEARSRSVRATPG